MIRVVLVDDEPRVRRLHRTFLARVPGVEVVAETALGAEALGLVREHGADLVLLDIGLPDLDGRQVLRQLRAALGEEVAVIMITAVADLEAVRGAVRAGVDDYLVKPFPMEDFIERVGRVRDLVVARRSPSAAALTQAEVDALVRGASDAAGSSPPAAPSTPKGFQERTLELVAGALEARPDGCSATELADATGVSRVTARRYLDLLVERGAAVLDLDYGTAGRPRHRYRPR